MTLPLDPDELEAAARERLAPAAYAYFSAGAGAEVTLDENVAAWRHWHIVPRVLRDVSAVDLTVTLLGTTISMPVLTAPAAVNRLADPGAELAVARAASTAGTIQVVSALSSESPEAIARASPGPKWFQLYVFAGSRELTDDRIRRAEDAGYVALVITVDLPVFGVRYRGLGGLQDMDDESAARLGELIACADPALDWDEVARIGEVTRLPVLLKGILHPGDARLAAEAGMAGVIVSNHGARQLDGSRPTALALPEVVEAVAGRCTVLVDGGLRTGVDVLRALALGADSVMIGRPYLWALACAGAAGVEELLTRLREQTYNALALAGQSRAGAVDRDIVAPSELR